MQKYSPPFLIVVGRQHDKKHVSNLHLLCFAVDMDGYEDDKKYKHW